MNTDSKILNMNNGILVNCINIVIILNPPTKLPSITLIHGAFLLRSKSTDNRSEKSNTKFINIIKST